MKSEAEIRDRVMYLKGYIEGQNKSFAADDRDVQRAEIELKTLEDVLGDNDDE